MKPHTYAGYLFPLEEEVAKKEKQFYIYLTIDKASLTVHPCVHNTTIEPINKICHLTIILSIDSIFSLSLHLLIKSRYFIASREGRPSRRSFNNRLCVPCITSKHCSSALNSCSLLNSKASISGSISTSSSAKCCLHFP